MPDRSRIPKVIDQFDAYINSTDNFLQAMAFGTTKNWERLGMLQVNADKWHDKRVFWRDDLHKKYSDKAQSTSIIKKEVAAFIKEFKSFGSPQLNIMAANPSATNADEAIFRFIIKAAKATRTSVHIADRVSFVVKHKGGSDLQFICTNGHDANRASKAEGSDSVQMAYMILDEKGEAAAASSIDNYPGYDDLRMTREIFTKARFNKHMGGANLAKKVVIYMRWYNTKHPALAGPWSEMMVVVIA